MIFLIFVVTLNFAARRRQRRGTGLGREEIGIGRALAWASRPLARLLTVCHLCFQTTNSFRYCTKFVYIVFTCFNFMNPDGSAHLWLFCVDHIYQSPLLLVYFFLELCQCIMPYASFFPFPRN